MTSKDSIDEKLYEYCSEQMDMMLKDIEEHGKLEDSGGEQSVRGRDRSNQNHASRVNDLPTDSKLPEPIKICRTCRYRGMDGNVCSSCIPLHHHWEPKTEPEDKLVGVEVICPQCNIKNYFWFRSGKSLIEEFLKDLDGDIHFYNIREQLKRKWKGRIK